MRQVIWRGIFGLIAGFVMMTQCDIGWGISTPGDDFGNESHWMGISYLGSALVGFALGCIIKARAFRIEVIVLAVAAVLFDLFAPHKWWVKPISA